MKSYLTYSLFALALLPAMACAGYPPLGGTSVAVAAGKQQVKRCQSLAACQEQRRLRNLRLREAVKDGDISSDQMHHAQHRRLMPPSSAEGQPGTPPSQPNYWRDKLKKSQEQNQAD
ncbi:hypothetical protein CEK28_14405 [Xenophilus sp. AP218F]|nr:hypothetical protein [Chromobacterium sp. ASV5]OWY38110.1 hypothetical protein CEK28_14405 [Xenophilus sp. AP218F]